MPRTEFDDDAAICWTSVFFLFAGTGVDGLRAMRKAGSIKAIIVMLADSGNSGSTIIDIHKHVPTKPITTQRNNTLGTTIYTTQANRPTLTASSGQNAIVQATDPDVMAFEAGDFFSMDVDQKGFRARGLSAIMYVQYD